MTFIISWKGKGTLFDWLVAETEATTSVINRVAKRRA